MKGQKVIRRVSRDLPGSPWLRLHASNAGGVGSIPGQGTKIPHAVWHSQKKKKVRVSPRERTHKPRGISVTPPNISDSKIWAPVTTLKRRRIKATRYKINKQQKYNVQHREHNQYFIIILNAI